MRIQNDLDKLGKWPKAKRVQLSAERKVVCSRLRCRLQDSRKDGKVAMKELGGQSKHKMNMCQGGQAVAKNANIVLGCINNVGICKKHEIVLLLSHHGWSTGSSLGHCISRKM